MIPQARLKKIVDRRQLIQDALLKETDHRIIADLSREFSRLRPMAELATQYFDLQAELEDVEELRSDPELRQLATEEMAVLSARIEELEADVIEMLLQDEGGDDEKSVVLEIRAGTGGMEAALFGGVLYRMYMRYAELRNWTFEPLHSSDTSLGGLREAVILVEGRGAFARLKFESGVHRVQRVPTTESSGRIHTSAATVAILPEAGDVDVEIAPEDVRIDTMRASGAGGQHVNTTDSAVRVTHLPTGITVVSSLKSQHRNRSQALTVLRTRLLELERQRATDERASSRRSMVGSGDRSERIRTYNYPQGRVSDHRIDLTLYKLEQILEGDLDELIDALAAHERATRLANFEC
ncbi:MAG: peptide chain release factor 1 [Rhodobacteraceae bacterium]|nr:peptide chain release factor 1 [Paracoccaceae bacterium]